MSPSSLLMDAAQLWEEGDRRRARLRVATLLIRFTHSSKSIGETR